MDLGDGWRRQDAYLLVCRGRDYNVIHQDRYQLGDSIHAGSKGAVLGRTVDDLTLLLCLVHPLPGHRVYDIKNTELVSAWGLLEVRVDFLNEDRLGLATILCQLDKSPCGCRHPLS